jgi:hypothetical protein
MKETELSECSDEPGSTQSASVERHPHFEVPNHADLPPNLGVPPRSTSVPLADTDLARRARDTLKWVTTLPEGLIDVSAEDANLTLVGTVDCPSMKEAAEEAVRHLEGVGEIRNLIEVEPKPTA